MGGWCYEACQPKLFSTGISTISNENFSLIRKGCLPSDSDSEGTDARFRVMIFFSEPFNSFQFVPNILVPFSPRVAVDHDAMICFVRVAALRQEFRVL